MKRLILSLFLLVLSVPSFAQEPAPGMPNGDGLRPGIVLAKGKPSSGSDRPNTNYWGGTLPSGYRLSDGYVLTFPTYVTALCDKTTLVCTISTPGTFTGKTFSLTKNASGQLVPK